MQGKLIGATVMAAALAAPPSAAQSTAPLVQRKVRVALDSGAVHNEGPTRDVVWSSLVRVEGAPWLRLFFDRADLGPAAAGAGAPSVLRLTGVADGAVQTHTATTLGQWRLTSAYFNGDSVRLEIVADPGAGESRVSLSHVMAGIPGDGKGGGGGGGGTISTICGATDDRLPSSDRRAGRVLAVGCTVWLINDAQNCLLTAGHCAASALDVVQFNVPLSTPGGMLQHPGPEDQYAVDPASTQLTNGGIGNDWGYFGCFANSETGMSPGEAQGSSFTLAAAPPPVVNQLIRITGYGTDSSPSEWNQIQQTHAGPYASFNGTTVQYATDTMGGNSGSPVIDETTGLAIGIHTHGGCSGGGGANSGTAINHGGLQGALSTPGGVCLPEPPLAFAFPDGLPETLDPSGDLIRVEVTGQNGGSPEPDTGLLHYDAGSGFVAVPMAVVSPGVYDAVFPPIACTTFVRYYVSAESTRGEVVNNPLFAPDAWHGAISAVAVTELFADDFQSDLGWTVSNLPGLTAGAWQRGVPAGGGDRGDPPFDADGSGQCYLTQNVDGDSDVDNGTTILTSPVMDASAGVPLIGYSRWFSNTFGSAPFQDVFTVEVSDDGGSSWTNLETVGPAGPEVDGNWFEKGLLVGDFVTPTDQFRIRFRASDTDPQSVVEAGVDGVRLIGLECSAGCPGDCGDGDGTVGVVDLLELLSRWGGSGPCDVDGRGVGIGDLLALLAAWGPCG